MNSSLPSKDVSKRTAELFAELRAKGHGEVADAFDKTLREIERLTRALNHIAGGGVYPAVVAQFAADVVGGTTPEPEVVHRGGECICPCRGNWADERQRLLTAAACRCHCHVAEFRELVERAAQPPGVNVEAIATKVVRSVCELPDYNSPADQPELLTCTASELHAAVVNALEGHALPPSPEPLATVVCEWIERRRKALSKQGITSGHYIADLCLLEEVMNDCLRGASETKGANDA